MLKGGQSRDGMGGSYARERFHDGSDACDRRELESRLGSREGAPCAGLQGRHLPEVPREMRGAEQSAPGQPEQPLPLGLLLPKRE